MNRSDALRAAHQLVSENRNAEYGEPAVNFLRTAVLWNTTFGWDVSPADVALAMTLVKVSRLSHDRAQQDGWIDIAGYAAIGAELAPGGKEENNG